LKEKIVFHRLDAIVRVKALDAEPDFNAMQTILENERAHIWGVSCGAYHVEHIEMKLSIDPKDVHIIHRLEREKRCGDAWQISENEWVFAADVYDAQELVPWLRTFIGRICSLTCSNKKVERQFWDDYNALTEMYGGGGDAV